MDGKIQIASRLARPLTVMSLRIAALFVLTLGTGSFRAVAQINELFAFQFDNATSNYPTGQGPFAELIQGADGNYYGTTSAGGTGTCPGGIGGQTQGCGAVVKITSKGKFSVVYSFPFDSAKQIAPNGTDILAGLVQGPDGNFYGTAAYGGTQGSCPLTFITNVGCGTVFRLTPNGHTKILHSFCGSDGCNPVEGAVPIGRMVFGRDGKLYGTTNSGGVANGIFNSGTIFRISRSGQFETLHVFSGNSGTGDGANPVGGLIQASDGNFYGTTAHGGLSGSGSVFKMTLAGSVIVLHSFSSSDANGLFPQSALIEASDGNLYGTCYEGGVNSVGTIFRISKSGKFQKIYDFNFAAGNLGYDPTAGLIQASDGNLYGTTSTGGTTNSGAVYQVTLSGAASPVASFDASTSGNLPQDVPLQGSDGNFYLTAQQGGGLNSHGFSDRGTIAFIASKLKPLPPTVSGFSPAKGKVGAKITIRGSSFVGTSAVQFNGTAANFTVEGSGFIVTTVPNGATSGPISVTTSAGTAKSKNSFIVVHDSVSQQDERPQ
jgi:uncharacterized repeat protein (TIGR03803 family)